MSKPADTHPLKIFNASAGSGKTYRLVKEYIKLLLDEEKSDHQFAHILAMTFTNKAALEMKERIIKALDEISRSANESLLDQLVEETTNDPAWITSKCKRILTQILHRYEDFHVMTIDKFNLRLIKSFSRDLDLPAEFEVIMNEAEMIEKIVDELFSRLGDKSAENLDKLMLTYAKSNVEEGNKWNFRADLIKFGLILNKEQNQPMVERLLAMDFSNDKRSELYATKATYDKEFVAICDRLKDAISASGLNPDLLPGKSTTYKAIIGLSQETGFKKGDTLFNKTLEKNLDAELKAGQHFPEEVKQVLFELNTYWEERIADYELLDLFLKNFFNMALLQYIAAEIKEVRKEEQMIRISEFNLLISELIQKENALYIYERLGSKFHHFLLDEFQDTSRLQWLNLVPLVHDSLGNKRMNLIVGDPKQSIYRFKNGVAEQFIELPGVYNPEGDRELELSSNYFKQVGKVEELDSNWRSACNIIDFNNKLFGELKDQLSENTADFYKSIVQKPVSKHDGRIHVRSYEGKPELDETVDIIVDQIEECKNAGYSYSDICILGYRNKDCNQWAIELTKRDYKIVSSDSLLIKSDLGVQLTIAYLNWRLHPKGQNEMKRFAELHFRIKDESNVNDFLSYIDEVPKDNGQGTMRLFNPIRFVNDHFGGLDKFFPEFEGLYDLIQKFYGIMQWNELKNPYLHHLADFAFEFGKNKGPDIQFFLDEYERTKKDNAVQVPASKDAIEVMTMHKAKGLEFPVVIIPTLNMKLDVKGSFLMDVDDFIVYKKPSQNEMLEALREFYNKEKDQVFVDALNLCYVALTRPQNRLYITNAFEKNGFGALLHDKLKGLEGVREDGGVLEFDHAPLNEKIPADNTEERKFSPKDNKDILWFPDIALQDNEDVFEEEYLSDEQRFGRQFHLLISRISSKEMVDKELKTGILNGDYESAFEDDLRTKVKDAMSFASYQGLLENAKQTLEEQSFIVENGEELRPDKIILKEDETILIDFKTGIPNQRDEKQVARYKTTLESMGYPKVSSYLYYIREERKDLRLINA
ncbi:MAG: UvrD-helicase domain-containing protein [Crocinitomicaceae bacterium]